LPLGELDWKDKGVTLKSFQFRTLLLALSVAIPVLAEVPDQADASTPAGIPEYSYDYCSRAGDHRERCYGLIAKAYHFDEVALKTCEAMVGKRSSESYYTKDQMRVDCLESITNKTYHPKPLAFCVDTHEKWGSGFSDCVKTVGKRAPRPIDTTHIRDVLDRTAAITPSTDAYYADIQKLREMVKDEANFDGNAFIEALDKGVRRQFPPICPSRTACAVMQTLRKEIRDIYGV
jgi:hypothetical protein